MFRPGRLIALAIFGALIYFGFYHVPGPRPDGSAIDPASVAAHEASAWQGAIVREDFSTIVSCVMYQRELHRMTWFRAVESGMALSRALSSFILMTERYERIAPRLEEVIMIERAWSEADYDVAVVSRQQATWMSMARAARRTDVQRVTAEMAAELETRLGLAPGMALPAAADRAEAMRQILPRNASPDWDQITLLLTRSYTNLNAALASRSADARPAF